MYLEAVVVTTFGILALTVLRRFEDKDIQRRRVSVVLGAEAVGIEPVAEALRSLGATVVEVEYERHMEDEKRKIVVTMDVQLSETVPIPKLIEALESVPGVRRVHVQHRG
jgi:putative Mg2+ transporter-C (MgtC) family protein